MPQPKVAMFSKEGPVGWVIVNNPPVNALSHALRLGLKECVEQGIADGGVEAMVLVCEGRTFMAGADIRELGTPPAEPLLPEVIRIIEDSPKPIIAAIHGTALGGGFEVALGCHFRIGLLSAKVGLPEVKLGLIPGAGGTQRLPRLVGVKKALEMIVSGEPTPAHEAKPLGVLDEVFEANLKKAALDFANRVIAEKRPLKRLRELAPKLDSPFVFDEFTTSIERKVRGFIAPFKAIEAIKAAVELPFDKGMEREREIFMELLASDQSKALRHVFFAEREVRRIPGLPENTPVREVKSAGIVGAGTMGSGIAVCFANAGIPVTIVEVSQEALDRGLRTIQKTYDGSVAKGRLTQQEANRRISLIKPTLTYEALKEADIIIEAVFEDMAIKKDVFAKLDSVAKPGAILASNTSYLNIDEIAAGTKRPKDVMGMHFFSPAHVMRLLENVRGAKTAQDVLATAMKLGRTLGKVPVLVGVCEGFVGNRMLAKRTRECYFLLEEGALPWQIDRVLYDFGFPMGPFVMADMAGLDIGWRYRKAKLGALSPRERACDILDKICEMGRYGQKTGAGFYRYDKGREPRPDPLIEELIVKHSQKLGIQRREVSDQEILERTLYSMINEGAKILEEGIAYRPHDIDIVWVYGYGFPRYRGGPMFYADTLGLEKIYGAILKYQKAYGAEFWTPSALLENLAKETKGFYSV